jgi:hypothetical protein
MNYIKNAKGKVFRLKKYLDNYIDNPNNDNLIILESFLEQLGFYIKNNENFKENSKRIKLKYFLSNLTTIIQSDLEYSKKLDIINIFSTIQAEFQQPINKEYNNVYMFDHNNRQFNPSGYFHLKLSQKINKKYQNITNTSIHKKTIKKNKTINIGRTIKRTRSRSRSRNISRSRSRSRIMSRSRSRSRIMSIS